MGSVAIPKEEEIISTKLDSGILLVKNISSMIAWYCQGGRVETQYCRSLSRHLNKTDFDSQ